MSESESVQSSRAGTIFEGVITMRINGTHLIQAVGTYMKQVKKQDPTAQVNLDKTDQVSVSRQAGDILKTRRLYDKLPEIREDRVAEIKQQYQDGTYQQDDSKVSQQMLLQAIREKLINHGEG
jgi:flagellar biosynthesis anti-sigma factor FlgM